MEKDGNVSTLESVCRLKEDIANDLSDDNICTTEFNESSGRERDVKKKKTKRSKK